MFLWECVWVCVREGVWGCGWGRRGGAFSATEETGCRGIRQGLIISLVPAAACFLPAWLLFQWQHADTTRFGMR